MKFALVECHLDITLYAWNVLPIACNNNNFYNNNNNIIHVDYIIIYILYYIYISERIKYTEIEILMQYNIYCIVAACNMETLYPKHPDVSASTARAPRSTIAHASCVSIMARI